jgi:hypothetical protein
MWFLLDIWSDCTRPFREDFVGFHPDDLFCRQVSVDMAELILVFGTLALTMGFMVWFGNWWSR